MKASLERFCSIKNEHKIVYLNLPVKVVNI